VVSVGREGRWQTVPERRRPGWTRGAPTSSDIRPHPRGVIVADSTTSASSLHTVSHFAFIVKGHRVGTYRGRRSDEQTHGEGVSGRSCWPPFGGWFRGVGRLGRYHAGERHQRAGAPQSSPGAGTGFAAPGRRSGLIGYEPLAGRGAPVRVPLPRCVGQVALDRLPSDRRRAGGHTGGGRNPTAGGAGGGPGRAWGGGPGGWGGAGRPWLADWAPDGPTV